MMPTSPVTSGRTPAQFDGIVHEILKPFNSGKGFYKQDLIVVDDLESQYPRFVPFTFIKSKTSLLNNLRKGQRVSVFYYASGRKWVKDGVTRYFPEVIGYDLKVTDTDSTPEAEPEEVTSTEPETEDIPF